MSSNVYVSDPSNVPLIHYYRDSFSLLVIITNGGTPINITGHTFQFTINTSQEMDDNLVQPAITTIPVSGQIFINGANPLYANLVPNVTYYYKLISTYGTTIQTIIAGKYSFTAKANSSNYPLVTSITVPYITNTITVQVGFLVSSSGLSFGSGSDVQMAAKALELVGQPPGSYIFINTDQGRPYTWFGVNGWSFL
jgi:hypothetical protein